MEELLQKKYRLEIEFFGRFHKPKKIEFIYKQGSLRQLLEMKADLTDSEKIRTWLFNFLVKSVQQNDKLTLKLFNQLSTGEINSILEFLINTFAKGFFTKNTDTKEKTSTEKSPTNSTICTILEKTNETVESLLDMTWEQISYLVDGIVWNLNSQSKKGQDKNARSMRMKDLKDGFANTEMDEVKALEERMKQSKLKK